MYCGALTYVEVKHKANRAQIGREGGIIFLFLIQFM